MECSVNMESKIKHRLIAVIILLLMVIGQIGTDVYLASLPAIHVALNTSTSTTQYTFSIFLTGFALSQLFYGPLSDRYGRKPFIIFGLFLYTVTGLLCASSTNIIELLAARFFQGVGAGACTVIARAIMRDTFDGKDLNKMNIYQSMVWSMVPISAPLLGSYIQYYLGWRYNFLLLSVLSTFLLVLCWFKLPETIKIKEQTISVRQIFNDYKKIFYEKSFFPYLIFSACIVSLFAVFNISAPLIIQIIFKQSVIVYGWVVFSVAVTFLMGSLISRVLIHQISSKQLMLLGLIIIILAGIALLFVSSMNEPTLYKFLIAIIIMQIGSAVAFPSAAAESMRPFIQKAGKSAAIFGCTLFLSSALFSGIMSYLHEKNLMPFSIMINFLIVIMVFSYMMIPKHLTAENTEIKNDKNTHY